MVSVPYSERRHRLRGDELEPVREVVHRDLLRRIEAHDARAFSLKRYKKFSQLLRKIDPPNNRSHAINNYIVL